VNPSFGLSRFRPFSTKTIHGRTPHDIKGKNAIFLWLFLGLSALFLSVFFGLLAVVFPWWLVIGLFVAPVAFLVAGRYPLFGLILALFFLFNVIPERFVPQIPFVGGKLKIHDLLLIYLATVMFFRYLMREQSIRDLLGPSFWPLIYVLACVAFGTVHGRLYLHEEFALSEARNHIGWLVIPLLALCVDTPQRFKILLRALLFAAVVIAIYVVIQSTFDINIMGGRVELLDAEENADVVRSTAGGGVYLIVFALLYFLGMAQSRRMSWWLVLPLVMVLLAGLGFTFGRGVWVATATGLFVASILYRGFLHGVVVAIVGTTFLLTLLAGASVVNPRVVEVMVDRATGITKELESGGSFGSREIENAAALKMIQTKPWFGTGLGGAYKPVVRPAGKILSADSLNAEARYIHNSFLYFPLKMGLFAVAVPFVFMLAFVSIYKDWFVGLSRRSRTVPAAIAGAFLAPMLTSFTQPEWGASQGIVAISVLFMLAWLFRRLGIEYTETGVTRSQAG
jgi:O-antigen ligase